MPPAHAIPDLEALHERAYGWALVCARGDRDQAREILQSAYTRILDGSARWSAQGEFRSFVFGIVRRVSLELARGSSSEDEARGELAERIEARPAMRSTLEQLVREETHESLRRAVRRLPGRQREVLHLVFYQELTLVESAAILGIGVGSVRQHYARAKATLRDETTLLREAR